MFREDKATAMAVYFLRMTLNHKLDDLGLMKLMYIAERECMEQTTSLITGARFVSMKNGPVLSEILDAMRGNTSARFWQQHIQFEPYRGPGTSSNHCVLIEDLDITQYLSEFEIDLLTCVWKTHKDKSKWDLVELTHAFPEWDKTCQTTKSSTPIMLEDIYRLGFNEPIDVARERAEEIEYFEKVTQ